MFSVRNKSQSKAYVTSRPQPYYNPSINPISDQENNRQPYIKTRNYNTNNHNHNHNHHTIQQLQNICEGLVNEKRTLQAIIKKNQHEYSLKISSATLEISRLNCLLDEKNDQLQQLQKLIESLSYKNQQLSLKIQTKQTLLYSLRNKQNTDINDQREEKQLRKSRFYDTQTINNVKGKMQKLLMLNQQYEEKLVLIATQFSRMNKIKENSHQLSQLYQKCQGRDHYINSLLQRIQSLQAQVMQLKQQFNNIIRTYSQ